MREIISTVLIIIGATFMFISALGVVRMPDLYLRMSASTKSATLGVVTMLLATAIYFNEISIITRAIATIIFLLLTAPVAAHMMGRAAYFTGVPLWSGSLYDELKGRYDAKTHSLVGLEPLEVDTTLEEPQPKSTS